jgi:cbb3-type cytochrome oxidase maturation protein
MSALAMTLMIGIFVMLIVVVAFIFSAKSGQYDDLDGSAHRILMDDDDPRIPGNTLKRNNKDNKEKTTE